MRSFVSSWKNFYTFFNKWSGDSFSRGQFFRVSTFSYPLRDVIFVAGIPTRKSYSVYARKNTETVTRNLTRVRRKKGKKKT